MHLREAYKIIEQTVKPFSKEKYFILFCNLLRSLYKTHSNIHRITHLTELMGIRKIPVTEAWKRFKNSTLKDIILDIEVSPKDEIDKDYKGERIEKIILPEIAFCYIKFKAMQVYNAISSISKNYKISRIRLIEMYLKINRKWLYFQKYGKEKKDEDNDVLNVNLFIGDFSLDKFLKKTIRLKHIQEDSGKINAFVFCDIKKGRTSREKSSENFDKTYKKIVEGNNTFNLQNFLDEKITNIHSLKRERFLSDSKSNKSIRKKNITIDSNDSRKEKRIFKPFKYNLNISKSIKNINLPKLTKNNLKLNNLKKIYTKSSKIRNINSSLIRNNTNRINIFKRNEEQKNNKDFFESKDFYYL